MMLLTDNLDLAMKHVKGPMTAQGKQILDLVDHYNSHIYMMRQDESGAIVAHSMHKQIDKLLKESIKNRPPENGKTISCKSGCSACCHIQVRIADVEAELLLEAYDFDADVLNRISQLSKIKDGEWGVRACPFLKSNKCSVYEHRPAACRTQFVTSHKSKCDVKNGVTIVDRYLSIEAEGCTSALWSSYETGPLAQVMQKKIME